MRMWPRIMGKIINCNFHSCCLATPGLCARYANETPMNASHEYFNNAKSSACAYGQ